MSLFLTLLPLYLFGNLHCMGMCGPLVMMLGQNRYRHLYFLGRTFSFTLAGAIAGEVGSILNILFRQFHIAAAASFLFGGVIVFAGVCSLGRWQYPVPQWLAAPLQTVSQRLTLLLLREHPLSTFLFGFFTITLPCGQTLVVFSACALSGDVWTGLGNGLAFALLTSPSLALAMHAHTLFRRLKPYYNSIMGVCALVVGTLAICRGLAELEIIPHLTMGPNSNPLSHLVFF